MNQNHWGLDAPLSKTMKFLGINMQRVNRKEATKELPEGSILMSQQEYIMETLIRFTPSLNYRSRTNPGDPDSFSKSRKFSEFQGDSAKSAYGFVDKAIAMVAKLSESDQVDHVEHMEKLPAIVGTLLWIAGRTRPDISWAVTRIVMSAKTEDPELVEDESRVLVKHILQYLQSTLHFSLVIRPIAREYRNQMWIAGDASLSASGGKSHEGAVMYHGLARVVRDQKYECRNLVGWRSSKQALVALSSCEAELMAAVSAYNHAQPLLLSLGECVQKPVETLLSTDNSAALHLVHQGEKASYRTKHISIRGLYLYYLEKRKALRVDFVSGNAQPADASTKGLSGGTMPKVREMLRLVAVE